MLEYKGYKISQKFKTINKHNPISGHSWAEFEPLKGYTISGKHSYLAPNFRSIEAAKKWIDEDIAFCEEFPFNNTNEAAALNSAIEQKKREIKELKRDQFFDSGSIFEVLNITQHAKKLRDSLSLSEEKENEFLLDLADYTAATVKASRQK